MRSPAERRFDGVAGAAANRRTIEPGTFLRGVLTRAGWRFLDDLSVTELEELLEKQEHYLEAVRLELERRRQR